MKRTFVLGDIHGAHRALRQCLERARFDYAADQLICLGDVTDGWPDTRACIDELLRVKHLVYLLGNHDWWTRTWMETGEADSVWLEQGGSATIASYREGPDARHQKFLQDALPYYIMENRLFVHAGIRPGVPPEATGWETFLWDRSLAKLALAAAANQKQARLTVYDEVYIGHTPVWEGRPVYGGGVWLMDTGAGWQGVLTLMDVHTKEQYISDPVPELYRGMKGRK